jgi:DNA-binding transcriptional LysR family regulator
MDERMLEPVTLDQLRVLLAIAESGSFSAAARRLGRAQSAISHAVVGLEEALGIGLFDRSGRLPKLTEAGRTLLGDAKAIVARAQELRARAQCLAGGVEPELSLAVDITFPTDLLIESVRALQAAFPLLPITILTEAMGNVETRVREGTARLGISPNLEKAGNDGLQRLLLTDIPFIGVVAAEHPLARFDGPIPMKEMERHVQLVLSDRNWLLARAQGRSVASVFRGIVSPHAWRFVDLWTRYKFLRAGLGFCHMPVHVVAKDIEAGRLRQVEIEGMGSACFEVPHYLVRQAGSEPGRAAAWLIQDLQARFEIEMPGENERKSWRLPATREAGATSATHHPQASERRP